MQNSPQGIGLPLATCCAVDAYAGLPTVLCPAHEGEEGHAL